VALARLPPITAHHAAVALARPPPITPHHAAGVLVCACSEEARRALSRELERHGSSRPLGISKAGSKPRAAARGHGSNGGGQGGSEEPPQPPDHTRCRTGGLGKLRPSGGSSLSGSHGTSEDGGTPPPSGIRKIYRALVQGIIQAEEVGESETSAALLSCPPSLPVLPAVQDSKTARGRGSPVGLWRDEQTLYLRARSKAALPSACACTRAGCCS
jgi:hypothetical protein